MSQNSNTIVVTELHCSICNGFLSCSPVRLLPDGTFICGQCSPSSDSSTYRAQALETLLEKASFPCCFAGRGCTEFFMFGQTVEHELKCEYRWFTCPILQTACSWEGFTSQMFNHFIEAHQEQVLENATLKLEVNQNAEGVVTILKDNIAFVVKYKYNAEGTCFTYDIRFCKNDSIPSASYSLQLMNTSDHECTICLKAVECSVYDDSFCSSQTVQKLDLYKFLQCLDHPTSVLISIHFTVHPNNSYKGKLEIELLDSLKCGKCRNYLIPPLFELNESIICFDCVETNENYLPLNDKVLLETLNTTMFPCCWQNCKFIMKNKDLKKHQVECQFRQYNCFWDSCCTTFTLASAANHYIEEHECQYVEKEIRFEVSLAQRNDKCDVLTIKKHTIIDLEYFVFEKDDRKIINLCLYSSDEPIKGSIHFEDQHGKVKSKSFKIICKKDLKITLDQLPTCFKETDVLTGFLTISSHTYLL